MSQQLSLHLLEALFLEDILVGPAVCSLWLNLQQEWFFGDFLVSWSYPSNESQGLPG